MSRICLLLLLIACMPAAEDLPAATREAVLAAARAPVALLDGWAGERRWFDELMLRRLPAPADEAGRALHRRLLDQVFLGMVGAHSDRFDRALPAELEGHPLGASVPAAYLRWLVGPLSRNYQLASDYMAVLQKPGGKPLEWPCPLRFQVRASLVQGWRHAKEARDIAQADGLAADLAKRFLAAEKAGEFAGHDRLVYALVEDWPDYEHPLGKRPLSAAIDELAARRGEDDWLGCLLAGKRAYDRAWVARGDPTKRLSDEDKPVFAGHMARAEQLLAKAWRLHPERPEAATLLMVVATAHQTADPVDTWFGRALAGGFDGIRAWSIRASYLRPDWGGSRQAVLDLGILAVEQAPADSFAPRAFLDLVHLLKDAGTEAGIRAARDFISRPEVLRRYAEVVERLDRACGGPVGPSVRTSHALMLWHLGQRDQACAILRSIPHRQRAWSKCVAWRIDEREVRAAVADPEDPPAAAVGAEREEAGGSAF